MRSFFVLRILFVFTHFKYTIQSLLSHFAYCSPFATNDGVDENILQWFECALLLLLLLYVLMGLNLKIYCFLSQTLTQISIYILS
jgi:hypothetical protein